MTAPAKGFSGPTGGIKLGPAAAVRRLIACFQSHGWNPVTGSRDPTTPAAKRALAACASLIPAAVPGFERPCPLDSHLQSGRT